MTTSILIIIGIIILSGGVIYIIVNGLRNIIRARKLQNKSQLIINLVLMIVCLIGFLLIVAPTIAKAIHHI